MKKRILVMLAIVASTYASFAQKANNAASLVASIKDFSVNEKNISLKNIIKINELVINDVKTKSEEYTISSFKLLFVTPKTDSRDGVIAEYEDLNLGAKLSEGGKRFLLNAKPGYVIYIEEIKGINSNKKEISLPAIKLLVTE